MRKHLKYFLYLSVLIGFVSAHAGSYDDFFAAIEHNQADVVTTLIGQGFDANTPNPKGAHPLLLAVRAGSFKVVNALLADPKIDVNVLTAQGESALMLAALAGATDVCQKLIDKGADINKPGWTALHYAATGGSVPIIKMLLERHAYVDTESPNGSTPLMMAAKYGTADAVRALLDGGADPMIKNSLDLTALDFAYSNNRTDAAALIGVYVRAKQPKGSW
jgi:ankyrin repeat protein